MSYNELTSVSNCFRVTPLYMYCKMISVKAVKNIYNYTGHIMLTSLYLAIYCYKLIDSQLLVYTNRNISDPKWPLVNKLILMEHQYRTHNVLFINHLGPMISPTKLVSG